MPSAVDQTIATTVSQSVGMNRSPITVATGCPVRAERPRSPCAACTM